jgi:hypothetical protein
VSVAIPLFHSRRFVDRLAERCAPDRRVRFLRGRDGAGWVEHYNLLLQEGSGRYFAWLPHDDEFPRGYVSRLVACLETESDAVLAYGRLQPMSLDGQLLDRVVTSELPVREGEPWSFRTAARLLLSWQLAVAFRGVFRRELVVRSRLLLDPREPRAADFYWMFGLALLGPFRYVPDCTCRKSYHESSATARYGRRRLADVARGYRTLRSYARALVRDPRDRGAARAVIAAWALLEWAAIAGERLGVPERSRSSSRQALARLLLGRC